MSKGAKLILCVLTLISLLYIFSNSLKSTDGVEKTKEKVVETVESVVEAVTKKDVDLTKVSGAVVAKIGHVLEFSVFGALFSFTVFALRGKREEEAFYRIMFASSFVAITDEHLQLLGKGRGSQLSDVVLDLAACFLGYAISVLIWKLTERNLEQK